MQEIERKFLVTSEAFKEEAFNRERIVQGYLFSVPERTVRVRIKGNRGFVTVNGASDTSGISRYEWEKEIAFAEAEELLQLCEQGVIDKIRYEVKVGLYVYEVDVFNAQNHGLIIAEIELPDENAEYEKPLWLGKEVTGNSRYYNAMLSKQSYSDSEL